MDLNFQARLTVAICASVAVGVIPILLSFTLAQRQGRQIEEDRLLSYARNVLFRSERATQQLYAGIDRLARARQGDPCAPAQIALMSEIDLSSQDIQTMGYIEAGRLMCSSMGLHGAGLPISTGTPVTRGTDGSILYTRARLSIAPDITFIIVARNGYAAVMHEAITLDIGPSPDHVSLATYSPGSKIFRSQRGTIKPAWAEHALIGGQTTFDDGAHLVALVASQHFPTVTLAATPLSEVHQSSRQVAKFLVPFGVAAGIALGLLAFLMARRQMGMPALLRTALKRGELFLLYQPIVDLQSGRCIGAEALIRWRQPDGTIVPPDVFIPVAEKSGLIQRVTERVLEIVAADAGSLFAMHPGFHVSVNLAAADLKSHRTVELLAQLMHKTGAKAHNILVEATERGLMDADEVRQVIDAIHALGIEVAVDDFGTGYSSLSYLETFALDYLKIDKSFVDTLATGAATSQVAVHIIEMAKALKLRMIAEGVETEDQATLLKERGVQFAQGWLFARPMPMAALLSHIA